MGHQKHSRGESGDQFPQDPPKLAPEPGVNRRKGLIQEEQPPPRGQGAHQRHPLPLPSTQSGDATFQERPQLQEGDQVAQDPLPFLSGPGITQPETEVLLDIQVGKEGEILGHIGNPPSFGAERGHVASIHENRPFRRREETCDSFEQKSLARPGGADQNVALPALHSQVHPGEPEISRLQPEIAHLKQGSFSGPGGE